MDKTYITFLRKRDYKFIKEIGEGALGKTILIEDDIIDEQFVCKKYDPSNKEFKEMYFQNFVQEIKLLHKVYHPNIVRVFNYYLFPKSLTGYILMEYVDGDNIQEFSSKNPHLIADLFKQTISGFCYLEENKILHRDIRPGNILVSNDGILKIIDFGFGKQVHFNDHYDKSISLNWCYTPPKEFEEEIYDFKTEVYFVGKMFEEILVENQIEDFLYKEIISQMVKQKYSERYSDFKTIQRAIIAEQDFEIVFNASQKAVYRTFASNLISIFSKMYIGIYYNSDIVKIINNLEIILRKSSLEDYVQHPASISRVFVLGNFRYFEKVHFPVKALRDFLNLLKSVSRDKQIIILYNLWGRLDSIKKISPDTELPF